MNQSVGHSIPRKEGFEKVSGLTKYIDDLSLPGMIYGTTVRSPIARGRLKDIRFPKGTIPWDEFTLVTAKDIPGKNYVALIESDQPYLADDLINHPEEPVLLLAHPDKYLLERARQAIEVDIEPLPAILDLEAAASKEQIVWGKDNVFKTFLINKGDVDQVLAQKDVIIVEGEYETGAQEQLYIENNGMIAEYSKQDGVTIHGSLQCPYYVHKALMPLFDLPAEKVRVIQAETGGGFGGKEEYPSILAGHAALLAWKAGKPVKMIYDRAEDLVATTKRHPSKTKHRTAVNKAGKLLAMDIEFVLDGGAYATLSAVVLSRGTIHAAGPYECDNVRIASRAVATNTPPHGAFRGFGAPQSIFAIERHMNKIADKLGIPPEEFRRRNFLKDGALTATKQKVKDHVNMSNLMDNALKLAGYHEKLKQFADHNKKSRIKKGVGFATFMHGAGFTGSGERYLASVVNVAYGTNGKIHVLTSSTEIGQGTKTIFSQIASDALGINPDDIEVIQPDTKFVPNSGPTVASRTCMVVGLLVENAAKDLRDKLVKDGVLKPQYHRNEFMEACRKFAAKNDGLKGSAQYQQPKGIYWDDQKYEGEAYATHAWATYVAEVSVDTVTYEITVDDFVALQEIGKVVHPVLAQGQIEGGVVQGIGFAIYEKVVWKDGRMANNRLTNYIIPTPADVPPIRVYFEEQPTPHGPRGAKGIGELPMDGSGPAVINAIVNATGVSLNQMPILPEDLMIALQGNQG